jgi:hypothetical protein
MTYDWLEAMETPWPSRVDADAPSSARGPADPELSPFDAGFFVGVLVGEGHFGGDGRQPHVTLRMHTDHAALFEWLMARFPESRLYGPYDHSGRRYYQWMARSAFLRDRVVPILDRWFRPEHSQRAWDRYQAMKRTYRLTQAEPTAVE